MKLIHNPVRMHVVTKNDSIHNFWIFREEKSNGKFRIFKK